MAGIRHDLGVLGLTDDELNAYRELLRRPSCTSAELAASLGVAPGQAARLLARLEHLGLAAHSGESREQLTASPPELALGALLMEHQSALKRAEIELDSLGELYRTGVTHRASPEVIEVVRGSAAIRQRFTQLQLGARSEVRCLVQGPLLTVGIADNDVEVVVAARGVSYRIVWERRMLDEGPEMLDAVDRAIAAGEQFRIVDAVPLKLLIADRELALVPIAGSTNGSDAEGALLVRPSALLDALLALFDLVWEQASPVTVSAEGLAQESARGKVDHMDGRILGLLAAGLNDQAVASRLGLSLRTVQRRVHGLMELTGAKTRLQLGIQIAQIAGSSKLPESDARHRDEVNASASSG
ncbi:MULTISPECIES: helix-turn-helix transcriptional regulator [unclassified Streptomyces]|uniref:helix-turn-helix transcriptional regulator n=1 Tax=unclassified Streptomyces TaxID=2593676 RepID=UPI002DDA0305|nr:MULTISPECIES: helix-turn-helix transcriptional regulator [unclassified Streptomyces]WSD94641.1 helix-turn-helix transcriptional regulator [Streptomyces sp. NBC_01474]